MAQLPNMNLSPEATPWGREMQQRLLSSEQTNQNLQTELGNLRRTVNALIASDSTLADGSVTTPKIADGAVTDQKIVGVDGSKVSGTVSSATTAAEADGVTVAAYTRNASGPATWYAVWMNADRQLMRNTSSERFKTNIKPYKFGERVLNLVPVEYDRINGGHEHGLIAEQVFQHVPEIVTWFTEPGTDDPVIDGVRYDLLSVALLDTIKSLAHRIEVLESKVE